MSTKTRRRGGTPPAPITGVTFMPVKRRQKVSKRFAKRLKQVGMSEENLAKARARPSDAKS